MTLQTTWPRELVKRPTSLRQRKNWYPLQRREECELFPGESVKLESVPEASNYSLYWALPPRCGKSTLIWSLKRRVSLVFWIPSLWFPHYCLSIRFFWGGIAIFKHTWSHFTGWNPSLFEMGLAFRIVPVGNLSGLRTHEQGFHPALVSPIPHP